MNLFDGLTAPGVLRAPLFELDDVEAELRLDDAAQLAGFKGEGGVLEGLDHHPAPEPAEIAALVLASRVARKLSCQRGKVFARARAP